MLCSKSRLNSLWFLLVGVYQRQSFRSSTFGKFKRTETTHHNICCKCWRGYAQVCLDRIRLSYWYLSCDKRFTHRTFVTLKHVLQNHVSILAKSLIISFQYNIESVCFFYSNQVYFQKRTSSVLFLLALAAVLFVSSSFWKKRKSSFNHADHSFTIWRVNVL